MGKIFGIVLFIAAIAIAIWFFFGHRQNGAINPEAQSLAQSIVAALYATSSTDQSGQTVLQGSTATSGTTSQSASITNQKKFMNAILHTNKGDITIEFLPSQAPSTVANFEKLAGAGFYNGTKFHRVISGFMIQGGDPLTKDDSQAAAWGTGGPGYSFADEIGANNHNNTGTIAMANSGPNTNGSQFFINVADNNFLDTKHTVFGRVTAGMDVVHAIEGTKTGANDRPATPIVIESVILK